MKQDGPPTDVDPDTWGRKRLNEIMSPGFEPPSVVEQYKLGLLDNWAPGRVNKTWTPPREVLHEDGSLFGGCTAALADQMMSLATLTVIPGDKAFRTINLSMQYFNLCYSQPLCIEAEVVAQSKRLISVDVTFALEDGTLMARATGQMAVIAYPSL